MSYHLEFLASVRELLDVGRDLLSEVKLRVSKAEQFWRMMAASRRSATALTDFSSLVILYLLIVWKSVPSAVQRIGLVMAVPPSLVRRSLPGGMCFAGLPHFGHWRC